MGSTIAILGSARSQGNTRQLLDYIAGEQQMDIVDLLEVNISHYDYEHRNSSDDFVPLFKKILDYDNIVFATPVYWYGPSTEMKVFIDRLTDPLDLEALKDFGRKLRGKKTYLVCTSSSECASQMFLDPLVATFTYLGMKYRGHVHGNCRDGFVISKYVSDVEVFLDLIRS